MYKVYFVSGIWLQNDDYEEDIVDIKEYIETKGGRVKSIRKLKVGRKTMSVKVVMHNDGSEQVLQDGYWPDGIACRVWRDHE